jgi:hypothetical protein
MAKKMKRYGFAKKRSIRRQYQLWRAQRGESPPGISSRGSGVFEVRIGVPGNTSKKLLSGSSRISYRGKGIWAEAKR